MNGVEKSGNTMEIADRIGPDHPALTSVKRYIEIESTDLLRRIQIALAVRSEATNGGEDEYARGEVVNMIAEHSEALRRVEENFLYIADLSEELRNDQAIREVALRSMKPELIRDPFIFGTLPEFLQKIPSAIDWATTGALRIVKRDPRSIEKLAREIQIKAYPLAKKTAISMVQSDPTIIEGFPDILKADTDIYLASISSEDIEATRACIEKVFEGVSMRDFPKHIKLSFINWLTAEVLRGKIDTNGVYQVRLFNFNYEDEKKIIYIASKGMMGGVGGFFRPAFQYQELSNSFEDLQG